MTKQTEKKILKPLSNRVVAKRLEAKETAKGGIILPDSAKKQQEIAEIIAVGPGKKTESGNLLPMPVKVGDKILMDKYAGQEVTIDDEELIIARSDDLIAIIEE